MPCTVQDPGPGGVPAPSLQGLHAAHGVREKGQHLGKGRRAGVLMPPKIHVLKPTPPCWDTKKRGGELRCSSAARPWNPSPAPKKKRVGITQWIDTLEKGGREQVRPL